MGRRLDWILQEASGDGDFIPLAKQLFYIRTSYILCKKAKILMQKSWRSGLLASTSVRSWNGIVILDFGSIKHTGQVWLRISTLASSFIQLWLTDSVRRRPIYEMYISGRFSSLAEPWID